MILRTILRSGINARDADQCPFQVVPRDPFAPWIWYTNFVTNSEWIDKLIMIEEHHHHLSFIMAAGEIIASFFKYASISVAVAVLVRTLYATLLGLLTMLTFQSHVVCLHDIQMSG